MKFSAWCRWCSTRIVWNAKIREWHRTSPNKTLQVSDEYPYRQLNCCALAASGWHDPDPKRA